MTVSSVKTTELASWTQAVRTALTKAGLDADRMFSDAGLEMDALRDPDARYPIDRLNHLWAAAVAATGDPAFGLSVGRYVDPAMFHALGYTLMSSETLRDALQRIERYYRIIGNASEIRFAEGADEAALLFDIRDTQPRLAEEAVDAFLAILVRTLRYLAGPDFSPLRVEIQRSRPAATRVYRKALHAEVVFGRPTNAIVLAADDLGRRCRMANPELANHNAAIADRYLSRLDDAEAIVRIQKLIVERLDEGEPRAADIAARMNVSLRTLQRQLREEGTSFRELLDATRRELALSYLSERDVSITQLTYMLGFAETSSFSRAFRRWTGESPGEWQQK